MKERCTALTPYGVRCANGSFYGSYEGHCFAHAARYVFFGAANTTPKRKSVACIGMNAIYGDRCRNRTRFGVLCRAHRNATVVQYAKTG